MKLQLKALVSRNESPIPSQPGKVNRAVILAVQPHPDVPEGNITIALTNVSQETFDSFKGGSSIPITIGE
jgi:hypothetical protein